MKPRVLLVTPNWGWDRSPLPVDTLRPPPGLPLEFAYLAAGLGTAVDVSVLDAYLTEATTDDLSAAAACAPTAVVVSTTPSLLYWRCPPLSVDAVRTAVTAVREAADCPIVLIGPHPTHTPGWTLDSTGADACWRGAFERGLAPLLREGLASGSRHLHTRSRGTAAPWTDVAVAVLHPGQLPTAAFDRFAASPAYPPHMWCVTAEERARLPVLTSGALLESSRGCPWSCSYCAKGPVRDRFARRPAARVVAEVRELVRRGVDYVFFVDETFNLPGAGLDELLGELARLPVSFGFQGRADLMSPAMADALARSGCVYAELGVDVVSDTLAEDIGRRQHLARSERGVDTARAVLPVVRFNRLNLRTADYREIYPQGDEQEWEYPPDPAYPYPGAPLGDALMRRFGRTVFDWPFAQRYSWWLRLEVHLQRTQPELPSATVRSLEDAFLRLDTDAAAALARSLEGVTADPGFHQQNKFINGLGDNVRVRHPGAQRG
ncbi:radical SAM protein [Streptomyces sp. NPDC003717]|uniref:B12-binding domain-containing radical SAM protein n=1 Tax=Streptomyces sp. NPDC003717 TaxID=3154276 RepID=UPI0033A32E3E